MSKVHPGGGPVPLKLSSQVRTQADPDPDVESVEDPLMAVGIGLVVESVTDEHEPRRNETSRLMNTAFSGECLLDLRR